MAGKSATTVIVPEPTFPPGTWARFWTHIFRGMERIEIKDTKKTTTPKPDPNRG